MEENKQKIDKERIPLLLIESNSEGIYSKEFSQEINLVELYGFLLFYIESLEDRIKKSFQKDGR